MDGSTSITQVLQLDDLMVSYGFKLQTKTTVSSTTMLWSKWQTKLQISPWILIRAS